MKQDNRTILIIDDSNSALLLTDWVIKEAGYNTMVAENVKTAVEKLKNNKPDLIVLDLQMPEISGYDFLRMRAHLKIDDVPVIVLSAIDTPESVELTKSLGVSFFMSKPVNTDLLAEKVKEILS